MAENYTTGVHRLFYQAKSFQEGLVVTMDILSPLLVWEEGKVLTEKGKGLYYIDYDFSTPGSFAVVLYEEEKKVVAQNFCITSRSIFFAPSSSRGCSVINA